MYVRNGLGAFWDKALQFATDAGAAITGATAGQKWGDVIRNVGGSFNQAVFGGPGPQALAQQPGPAAPRPAYPSAPRPTFAPGFAAGAPTFLPMPMPAHEEKRTNWLLYGGIGAGAVVLYLLLRKPTPTVPR